MKSERMKEDLAALEEAEDRFLRVTGWVEKKGGWAISAESGFILTKEDAIRLQKQVIVHRGPTPPVEESNR